MGSRFLSRNMIGGIGISLNSTPTIILYTREKTNKKTPQKYNYTTYFSEYVFLVIITVTSP